MAAATVFVKKSAVDLRAIEGEDGLVDTRAGVFGVEGEVSGAGESGGGGEFPFDTRDSGLGGLLESEIGGVEVYDGGIVAAIPFAAWAYEFWIARAGHIQIEMSAQIFGKYRDNIGWSIDTVYVADPNRTAELRDTLVDNVGFDILVFGPGNPELIRGVRCPPSICVARPS